MVNLLFVSMVFLLNSGCNFYNLNKANDGAIGAIAPSSPYLAEVITSQVKKSDSPKNIIEIGAGTGVFTREIVKKMNPGDHLDVIEITPDLCKILQDEFGANTSINIFCGDVLDWKPEDKYDYLVLGLPFNSFPSELVKKLTTHIKSLAKPGALCSFFEYGVIKAYRYVTDWTNEDINSRSLINLFIHENEMHREHVFLNIPPAIVYFLRLL